MNNYMMPLIMEAWNDRKRVYKVVETIALQYVTTPEAIAALLPACYKPGQTPIVTIAFMECKNVDFMAGHGYSLASVTVRARFDGEQDHLEGDYALVMFETEGLPIILGRELIGIPKLPAQISPKKMVSDHRFRCEVSVWGHLLFGIEAGPFEKERTASNMQSLPVLGYKYIPSLDQDGVADVEYPTCLITDYTYEKLALGKSGEVFFGSPTSDEVSWYASIVNVLKTLPVLQVVAVVKTKSSNVLRVDLSHRLC